MRSDNEREVGTQLLVARNGVSPGTCWDGRDGRGEDGLGSERSRNVQRLADVLEGRQELLKKMTERDQGLISDELWNHITVRRRRRSMSLGGTSSQLVDGRTDEGSFEDLEDRESTRNGEEKLWQILALTQKAWTNSERDGDEAILDKAPRSTMAQKNKYSCDFQ